MKDFDTLGFIAYLESTFDGYSGMDGLHLREIVENLCHYALCKYSSEPGSEKQGKISSERTK